MHSSIHLQTFFAQGHRGPGASPWQGWDTPYMHVTMPLLLLFVAIKKILNGTLSKGALGCFCCGKKAFYYALKWYWTSFQMELQSQPILLLTLITSCAPIRTPGLQGLDGLLSCQCHCAQTVFRDALWCAHIFLAPFLFGYQDWWTNPHCHCYIPWIVSG